MAEEERERGFVDAWVWLAYTRALDSCGVLAVLSTFLIAQGAAVLSQFWLTIWSAQLLGDHVWLYVGVYAGLTMLFTFLTVSHPTDRRAAHVPRPPDLHVTSCAISRHLAPSRAISRR